MGVSNGGGLSPAAVGGFYPQDAFLNCFMGSNPAATIVPGNQPNALANTGNGSGALGVLTTGYHNVAFGVLALSTTTTGYGNTACGEGAGYQNTTGFINTFIGCNSGGYLVDGHANTGVGNSTLGWGKGSNQTGAGSNNTAVGESCLVNLTIGGNNSAVGHAALGQMTTGNYHAALGDQAGYNVVTSGSSTFLGAQSGFTDGTTATADNSGLTLVGYQAQATTGNCIVLGKAVATRPNLIFGAPGTAAAFGGGVGVIALTNAVTIPTTNNAGGGILYVSGGALIWRSAAGTLTTMGAA